MESNKNPKFWHQTNCIVCGTPFWSLIKREQKSCSGKCSGIYVARDPNRISKIKKTKLAKYGSETFANPDKAKQTCLEKYGVDNVSKAPEIIEKIRQANQDKFGVDWSFQAPEIKDKIKESIVEKYGVENIYSKCRDKRKGKLKQLSHIMVLKIHFNLRKSKKKIMDTTRARYGTDYPSQSNHVKLLARKKFIDSFYPILITDHKLNNQCIPLFTKEEYINSDRSNKYKFQCKICDSIFEDHIDGGHLPRCLICHPLQLIGTSQSEQEVAAYVKTLTTDVVLENVRDVLPSGLRTRCLYSFQEACY